MSHDHRSARYESRVNLNPWKNPSQNTEVHDQAQAESP